MKIKLIYFQFIPIDIVFWKNQEKQISLFYEQIDQRIGDFLIVTNSPYVDLYREIKERAMTGKMQFY
jgi:hypothetical protein